jgi:hypothetical protein
MLSVFFRYPQINNNNQYQNDAYGLIYLIKTTKTVKSIHHKIRSHHTTPRNPTMGESNCHQGLYSKSRNNFPQANYRGHPLSHPMAKTGAHIQYSRPMASALFPRFRSPHHRQSVAPPTEREPQIKTLIRVVVDTTKED